MDCPADAAATTGIGPRTPRLRRGLSRGRRGYDVDWPADAAATTGIVPRTHGDDSILTRGLSARGQCDFARRQARLLAGLVHRNDDAALVYKVWIRGQEAQEEQELDGRDRVDRELTWAVTKAGSRRRLDNSWTETATCPADDPRRGRGVSATQPYDYVPRGRSASWPRRQCLSADRP